MSGLFGSPAAAVLLVAVVAAVVLSLPPGRRALSALVGALARWPGLIRAELRGAAPLRVEDRGDAGVAHACTGDTTPDIPVVTRGLPVVERADRR